MIIKVQDKNLNDRFLVEAAYIRWDYVASGTTYAILEFYIVATQSRTAGIEAKPSLRLRINRGDRVFIMNSEGKTIDSKKIDLREKGHPHPHHYGDDDGCSSRSGAKEIDLCNSCVRQSDCTIAVGRTAGCIKFQPIGRE